MLRSPFPGMDPYLEDSWGDVHTQLIGRIAAQLQPELPEDLRARVQEHVTVDAGETRGGRYPDVRVVERPKLDAGTPASSKGSAAEPLVLEIPEFDEEPATQRMIEIRETRTGHRLITVIEVLSPANKVAGPNRELYLQKQRELKWSDVNLVELDLTRSGMPVLPLDDDQLPESHQTPYRVTVWKTIEPLRLSLYPLPLRKELSTVRIPLRETDEDVMLNLQEAIEYCYDVGGYDDIDYTAELVPPLKPQDAKWADELLTEKGLR